LTSVLYHNISEQETPFEQGLRVTTHPEILEQHLAYYQKNYDVIDLDTLLSGKLPRRPLLITFDDCYRSVLTAAERQLAPKGLPAVFFVNPSLVDGGLSLDNWIAWACGRHGVRAVAEALGGAVSEDITLAALIAGTLSSCSARKREAVRASLAARFPISDAELAQRSPMLTRDELKQFAGLGVEIGNHTASHVHCGALDPDEYEAELVGAKAALETMSGQRVRAFSVAYGDERDLPPAVLSALRDSGHEAMFLVHARSNVLRKAPDIWYRVSFRNEPASQLPLRLGVYPLIRTVRDTVFA
jgi:peptidoglycan/xylan/chitin deacetylase (PgdA/CDA1 family)